MAIFAILFIVIPLVEIYVAVQVGHAIGALNTIALLALISIAGIWLTKLAGFGVISRIRQQLAAGHMPTNELIEGGLVLTGGVLLVVPGFVTGALGLLLLLPPTRALARTLLKRRFQGRVTYFGETNFDAQSFRNPPGSGHLDGPDDIIDV
jgi:UPF0716 protein FxsA